ncbi:MAG: US12 family protein [Gomphosphaeria aponina SAG 52.96 = DSM 107014]|uniref:US12 family protein n=1 Tax=Gomphosphaeria aponina SAG 52.96 = DSM 107014 TaxID=1521640 RepID=A0A941GQF8_9CHRO|nr:US12 family protein [Gomphosphaeria aponina SAG 52.96 = DSM 107014]
MSITSNFRRAMQEAKSQSLIGPNVIAKALPYLGGGLVLTALGTYGGLGVFNTNPGMFMTTFWIGMIAQFAFFFVARHIAENGNNTTALPLLALYSLLSGYTLTGLIFIALQTPNVGFQGIGIAALGCGVTFIVGRNIGSNLSDEDGIALTRTVQLGIIGLLVVMVVQLLFSLFGVYTPSWLDIAISGVGVFIFAGAAMVDFYLLPRVYRDDQYLLAALSMYLTYINLFIFILRLLIAINGRD